MLLNFVFCIAGCAILGLVNVTSFLYGLGYESRTMTGGVPFGVLLLAAAILPLLACVCCFYASLSIGEKSPSHSRHPIVRGRIAIPPAEQARVEKLRVEKPRLTRMATR